MNIEQDLLRLNKALAAELCEYKETLSICQDRNARAHAETAAANARIRELEAEFVAYKDDATTAIAMYKKDVAEKCCRIRELEAELAADNELFQQRWREWQAERDRLDRSMRESWASEKRLAARIRELEAALRLIADAKDVRGCDEIARQALGVTAETVAKPGDDPNHFTNKPRACGLCGQRDIPRGIDWPHWIEGKPVHDICLMAHLRSAHDRAGK